MDKNYKNWLFSKRERCQWGCYVWFSMIVWMLGVVCLNDHNAKVLFEWDVEYCLSCFIYKILLYIIVYGYLTPISLFVCLLYLWWSYNVCVIREQMILQIILAWSRLTRGWGGLGSFYNIFSCVLNQILEIM